MGTRRAASKQGPVKRDELTPKQERFAQAYVETGNASEAYRRVYHPTTKKSTTINRAAHGVLENCKVAARVEALRDAARKRHSTTVEDLIAELEEARALGLQWPKQVGASVAATVAKAKILGLEAPAKLEVENKGGVMMVPVASAADFEKIAEEQQAALQQLVRKDGEG